MKTIFKSLVFLLTTYISASAGKDPTVVPMAFIRVVDAIAKGSGPLNVFFDGEDMRPKGYQLGDATGGIGLKPGTHKVKFVREGVVEGMTTVILEKDQTVTLIPFAELVPATDQKPAHFRVQILRLKQKSVDSGRVVTFVSVSARPELKAELMNDDGTWVGAFVKRLAIAEVGMKSSQAFVPVKLNGNMTNPIPMGGVGNYVMVLYDDADSKVQSLYFRDFRYFSAD